VTIFYSFRFETSLFVASYDSQGHCGGIRPRLHTGEFFWSRCESQESELLYDWRFIANQFVLAPSPLRLTARILFFSSIEHLRSYSLYNILSDERMGLSFTITAGPRQRIRSRVRVYWDSLSVASYDPQGYGVGIWPRLHMGGIRLPYITSGRTEERSPPFTVRISCVTLRCDGNVPSNGSRSTVESVTLEMCLSNRCLAMDYSGFQASYHNIHVMSRVIPEFV
jgi:hypothetical protein